MRRGRGSASHDLETAKTPFSEYEMRGRKRRTSGYLEASESPLVKLPLTGHLLLGVISSLEISWQQ